MHREFHSNTGLSFHAHLDLVEKRGERVVYSLSVSRNLEDKHVLGFVMASSGASACNQVVEFFELLGVAPGRKGWRGAGPQFRRV